MTAKFIPQLLVLFAVTAFLGHDAYAFTTISGGAPELDPGSVGSGLALASSIVVLLSHRGQKR